MYIVTIDNLYDPSITYCETKEEADSVAAQLVKEKREAGGFDDCKIYIAQIITWQSLKTNF